MDKKAEDVKFSIIMPVYNCENFIEECINSIITQKYTNWELLIVDDGSSDNSLYLCKNFAEQSDKIRVFHKENGGVSSARNYALNKISGDYLLFVDSDDMLTSDCLNNLYSTIINLRPDVCFHKYGIIRGSNIEYPINNAFTEPVDTVIENIYDTFIDNWVQFSATWSKCYKTSIIKKFNIRFAESINLYEDFLFLSCFLSHSTLIYMTTNIGYLYRVVKNSLSRKANLNICKCIKYVLNDLENHYSNNFVIDSYKLLINRMLVIGYCELDKDTRYKIIDICKHYNLYDFRNKVLWLYNVLVQKRVGNFLIDICTYPLIYLKIRLPKIITYGK